ncbi:23S rRNA (uracil(1939)-C(5))-methyltransferase RlmD [Suipraeoptans intestinalis]|uniref:23S rRNA (uracil(1939)-C(5))-methyltransferase RlmD n=1 Tax=Suipraeoptans intestinalis TaxID=2606628 RepID=UPI0023F11550|nr:23S rRNA (uracil(1939)-C(5))-methyltransferase RlmD [Suipraeoptans intestinalis]MDD7770074.1 23S rRNA (uracil(1939)-C(5))-methyltransferase RlmD [Suipraeoptans intestinalis]
MKKNEVVSFVIEDMGVNGEGIGKVAGYPLFVKDTVIGDVAEVKVTKVKKNYGYGRLMRLISPSPKRETAGVCPVARQCGGCQIQEMQYAYQLEFKQEKVKNNLIRIGGIQRTRLERILQPILGMAEPVRYRNKAQFPVGKDKNGEIITGFYAGRTHCIVPIEDCMLGVEENAVILEQIKGFMKRYQIPPYEEERHEGLVRHVLIRKGFVTGEIMVCLVINGRQLPQKEKLVELLKQIKGMKSISLSINTEKTNVIMGNRIRTIWGSPTITDYIGRLQYRISPLSFYQVNPVQTERLYQTALDYAGLTGKEVVWDLYCGIGTISLFLAKKARQVYGVEIVPQAIEDAKENARINRIENATFYVGKAEEILPEYYRNHEGECGRKAQADVIVVDPPRKGCEESLLQTIADMAPERVVYVSCDSATLARDVKLLEERGYRLEKVQPVDQFPNSVHVEAIVLLSKLDSKKYISVELPMDDMDLTSAESKATYKQIQNYVLEKFGFKVSTLYITQVKKKHGLEVKEHYNIPKNENQKVPQCPIEKEEAILDALKHFKML